MLIYVRYILKRLKEQHETLVSRYVKKKQVGQVTIVKTGILTGHDGQSKNHISCSLNSISIPKKNLILFYKNLNALILHNC